MEDKSLEIYYKQIEFCYGNVEWTHKIHEKAADICNFVNNILRWIQVILSIVVTTDIIKQLYDNSPSIGCLLLWCSVILTLINTITKTFDFGGRACKHIIAANSLWGLREDYRSFKNDIKAGVLDIKEIHVTRERLQNAVQEVYKTAPRTFDWAYKKAKEDFCQSKVSFSYLDEH